MMTTALVVSLSPLANVSRAFNHLRSQSPNLHLCGSVFSASSSLKSQAVIIDKSLFKVKHLIVSNSLNSNVKKAFSQIRTKPVGRWPSSDSSSNSYLLNQHTTISNGNELETLRSISRNSAIANIDLFDVDESGKAKKILDSQQYLKDLRENGYSMLLSFTDKENIEFLEFIDSNYVNCSNDSDKNNKINNAISIGAIGLETPFINNSPFSLISTGGILPKGAVCLALKPKDGSTFRTPQIVHSRLETLGPIHEITKCTGNVIREISGSHASAKLLNLTSKLSPVDGIQLDDQLWVRVFRDDNIEGQSSFKDAYGNQYTGAIYKVSTGDISKGMLALGELQTDLEEGMKIQFFKHIGPESIEKLKLNKKNDNDNKVGLPIKIIHVNKENIIPIDNSKDENKDLVPIKDFITIETENGIFLNDGTKSRIISKDNQDKPNDPVSGSIYISVPYSYIEL